MSEVFHLNARLMDGLEAMKKTRAVLDEGQRGPLTIGLDNEKAAMEVAGFLEGKGMTVQTYQQGAEWLVLGHPADAPEILVWYGPNGWQAAMDDTSQNSSTTAEGDKKETIIDLGRPINATLRAKESASPEQTETKNDHKEVVVVMVGSQFMGVGNDELGAKLAEAFFDTLAAVGNPPAALAFYNTGVFLTTRESSVLEALKEVESQGATLISCSVCLEFFDLKNELKVGRIGNMYEIINAQRSADRIIRI